ncbi:MAG: DUF5916 domain-containing protein [Gemmatimonadaceae bacterium]
MAPSATLGRAVRAEQAPVLDGRDDDAVWRNAPVMHQFRQFEPAEDGEPSLGTEVKVAYDDRNLYVLVRALDPNPDSIVSLLSRRDVRTNSDQIKIIIDAYHDRRTGAEFAVSPGGVKRDASIYNDFVEDMSWDGVWDAGTRIDSLGWIAEFRIPFSQLRFTAAASHTFGFGVWRDIARKNERVSWPLFRTSRNALASQLGEVSGFDGLSRSGRLELLPYVVTKNVTERRDAGWDHKQKVTLGGDVKYGVTSSMTLDATVNPDFGQVEADPAVLNLTAFEVRFDERRPFFQEGVGLFKCGGPCEGIFYTRRVGRTPQLRSEEGDPIFSTILGAAKLTGRFSNGLSLGLVEAVTQREEGVGGTTIEPQTNYLVGRAFKELRAGRSGVGTMVTAVNRDLDETTANFLRRDAYTALVQAFHRFGGDQYELMSYAGFNRVSGSDSAIARTQRNSVHLFQRPDHEERYDPARDHLKGMITAVGLQKIGGLARYGTFIRRATPGVELNDLGFVPLVNDIQIRNNASVQSARPGSFYRRLHGGAETETHWTTEGLLTGNGAEVGAFSELSNSWEVRANYEVSNLAGTHCVACARGGPALRLSPSHAATLEVGGDRRGVLIPAVAVSYQRGDGGRSSTRSAFASMSARVASRFSMEVGPNFEKRIDDAQWISNFGAITSDTTHFTFARLDQTTLGLVARANFTATPTLSLQMYAEPFVSSGSFSRWRELDEPRASAYEQRFKPYGGGQNPGGFNVKQFNSNAVVRWEYRPGSTLFLVWQQGRGQDELDAGSFDARRDYRNLFRAHPDNTFLIKASYWFNP